MKKQAKVLSLVALCAMTSGLQAGFAADHLAKSGVIVGYASDVLSGNRSKSLIMGAAVIALGNIAYKLRPFQYDDKGTRSVTGESEVSPMLADAAYAMAVGSGFAFAGNISAPADLSFKAVAEDAVLNAVAVYATEKIAERPGFNKLDRNHWVLRGWLPYDVKVDGVVKKMATGLALRAVAGKAWDAVKAGLATK